MPQPHTLTPLESPGVISMGSDTLRSALLALQLLLTPGPGVGVAAAAPVGLERLGTHVLIELYDAPFQLLNSTTAVAAALNAAVAAGGLTVVGELVHQFPVMGVSGILLISESHLSVHTWPERGYAAVDLFTCGEATPLPCRQHEAVQYGAGAWTCGTDGRPAVASGALWEATQAMRAHMSAAGASLTWLHRGLPAAAAGGHDLGKPPSAFGFNSWLGGGIADGDGEQQRPEL
jgi:S-adenosylmethionine decarboxylase proenzyme